MITAYDYDSYLAETKKLAKELGRKYSNLIFKTAYSRNTLGMSGNTDTDLAGIKNLRKFMKDLSLAIDDANIAVKFNNTRQCGQIIYKVKRGEYLFIDVFTDSSIPSPEVVQDEPGFADLFIPTYFKFNSSILDEIYSIFEIY